jgi:uncharacterized protein
LSRALAKPHPRIVGVDDGAFSRRDRWAPIAAVASAMPDRVDAVRTGRVRVDGTDGTRAVVALVRATGGLEGLRAVLLDGAVVGGFNVLDLDAIHKALGVPVVAVTRRPPDFASIRAALTKWFPRDAGRRWRLLTRHRLGPAPTGAPAGLLFVVVGARRADAAVLLRRAAVRGLYPEVLRLAHLVASAGSARSRLRTKD